MEIESHLPSILNSKELNMKNNIMMDEHQRDQSILKVNHTLTELSFSSPNLNGKDYSGAKFFYTEP